MPGSHRRRSAEADVTAPWPPELPRVEAARGVVATSTLLTEPDVDALVLPVAPAAEGEDGVQPRSGTVDAAVRYGIDLAEIAERLGVRGTAGEAHVLPLPRAIGGGADLPWSDLPSRVLLVGLGDGSPVALRRAGAAIARSTRGLGRVVTTVGADAGAVGVRALVEGYLLGAYRHPRVTDRASGPAAARALVLLGRYAESAIDSARQVAAATWTARVLTVTPSSTKNPAWMAEQAVALGAAAGLEVEVLGPEELVARGFGGLVAVGAGSDSGPRLVTVRYEPRPEGSRSGALPRHVVLVGKGITYDTGGISIKPRESMVAMKTDMAGSAVALATVLGAAAAGVRHRVTALLPLAENAVGASSYRPGDVLRLYGGTTVEIANTDAEGRLVLADALAHADRDLDPDVLIDVATLTGAATLGLGRQHGALYSPDERLASALVQAGLESGERLWRMPLVEDYLPATASTVADLRHVPSDPTIGGGSITAALFLREFVGRRRWAHLDVAGPARAAAASHEVPEGATGFGTRVLLRWLSQLR
ncbi:leucyl aminopeptidase family protein [Actinotalea soli]|uniref:leucyl aminopeptidase family protein n=1 Tax=Actinotalea soli TaxID=2819234 RepID=UPI0027DB60BA|nr:leucyl aminopeptidase family protein [Actinotalea soli]